MSFEGKPSFGGGIGGFTFLRLQPENQKPIPPFSSFGICSFLRKLKKTKESEGPDNFKLEEAGSFKKLWLRTSAWVINVVKSP